MTRYPLDLDYEVFYEVLYEAVTFRFIFCIFSNYCPSPEASCGRQIDCVVTLTTGDIEYNIPRFHPPTTFIANHVV